MAPVLFKNSLNLQMRLMRKLEAANISVKDKSQAVLLERAGIPQRHGDGFR